MSYKITILLPSIRSAIEFIKIPYSTMINFESLFKISNKCFTFLKSILANYISKFETMIEYRCPYIAFYEI